MTTLAPLNASDRLADWDHHSDISSQRLSVCLSVRPLTHTAAAAAAAAVGQLASSVDTHQQLLCSPFTADPVKALHFAILV